MPELPPRTPALRTRLGSLGVVRGGYVGPNATSNWPGSSELRALQASDIAPDGAIPWPTLRYVQPVRDGGRYAVGEGDLLLPLRSARPLAVVARGVPPGVIAAGHWAILSLNPVVAEPEFLAWYLNHPVTRTRLAQLIQGTKLQFLSLGALRDFEVEVPSVELQRRIARVSALHEHVMELEQQLAHARTQLVDALTMEALRAGSHSHDGPNGDPGSRGQADD